MSLLYSSSFKYPQIELRKNPDSMDSNHFQNNSGLTRYRSAPSSFLENLTTGGGAAGYEDYQYDRNSTPEIDNFLAKYMLVHNGSGEAGSHDVQEFGDGKSVKQEEEESATQFGGFSNASQMMYQSLSNENSASAGNNSLGSSFGPVGSIGLESSMQLEMGRNASSLARQSSSTADFFSKIAGQAGSTLMRDVSSFRSCNGGNSEATPSTSQLYGHLNLPSGASPRSRPNLPRIAELENETIGVSGSESGNLSYMNVSKRHFMSNLADDSWPNSSLTGQKRARETDGNLFPSLNKLPAQNVDLRERASTLTHHLSLPKSFGEIASLEKLMQFQGSVPCKIRAKRGCATHPRSIAERLRRTRISERMRKLQDLFPNLDKQTNTADMLDMAVEYIKDLQKQVKMLTDAKAKCTCSSIHKQYSNLST